MVLYVINIRLASGLCFIVISLLIETTVKEKRVFYYGNYLQF